MRAAVTDYCVELSRNPLLVQGSGGNISWKDAGTLWIKASGYGLAAAAAESIFLPVDLRHLRDAIARGDFTAAPKVLTDTPLRPSIETLLHGLMPHPLVLHLHPVEVLAHLVRRDADDSLRSRLPPAVRWASVAYAKPGAALARALAEALARKPKADAIFMHNHGVVIGGASIADLAGMLHVLSEALATTPRISKAIPPAELPAAAPHGYQRVADQEINQLACDPWLFERLTDAWALYPEQVVFLGAQAVTCDRLADLPAVDAGIAGAPPVFVRGLGVFVPPGFATTRLVMLRCYYEVLSRKTDIAAIRTLGAAEVGELVDWDAEKYRAQLIR
ncbi:MAG: class II aldolase/adducin family protein [Proteobacteria bacterium]|nr:class II aldolase/adducin family protein [Pseudomonadota bacterium]